MDILESSRSAVCSGWWGSPSSWVSRVPPIHVAVASQAAPVADGVHVHPPVEPGIWRVM